MYGIVLVQKNALAWFVLTSLGGVPSLVNLQAHGSRSAGEVIQQAVERTQQADVGTAQRGYTYTKVSVTEELDASRQGQGAQGEGVPGAFQAISSR